MKEKPCGKAWPGMVLALGSCLAAPMPGAAAEPLMLDTLRVTGSHLTRADLEGIAPVQVYDRQDIERSGSATLTEFIRDSVFTSAGVVDEQFTQGFSPGTAGIDLRGLGVNRTLVLLDGRRLPVHPFGQDGSQSFVDINSIPLAAIERIEVLTDGASAIYGADAVAGVVNIITRKDVDGVAVAVQGGGTDEGDGEEGRFSLTLGKLWERTSATVSLDFFKRNAIMARDRDISESADGPIDDRSVLGRPGTWIPLSPGALPPGLPVADPRCPADQIIADGPATFCGYDFAPSNTLVPETQRVGLVTNLQHELTGSLRVFGQALYNFTFTERDLAPTNNGQAPFMVAPNNPNNPTNQALMVLYRLEELGPRRDEFETHQISLRAGLGGYLGPWDWEGALGYARVDAETRGTNGYALAEDAQAAVDAGTLNPFGDSPGLDPDSLQYTTERDGESELYSADVTASGEVFQLPAGPAMLAVGAEVRRELFEDRFDELTASGAVLGVGGTSAKGDRNSQSTYAELAAPLLDSLEMQLALRFDHYSDFGSTVNPKLGLRWQPRGDLLMRFSAGTGFKAPALHELYSGEIQGFESLLDGGSLVSNVPVTTTGNEDLDAEKSRSLNLGVVWDVTSLWDLGVDGWYIKNKDAVVNNPQFILDNEASFPELVERDGAGDLVSLRSPFQNVAEQELWGIDLSSELRTPPTAYGAFTLGGVASYLASFEQQPAPGQDTEDLAGKDGRPHWRARVGLDWAGGAYRTGLAVNYIAGYEREAADDQVDEWTTVDARLRWQPQALQGGAITFGVDNVFDRAPPEDPFLEGWPFFNRALHDPRGRFFFLRYEHRM